MRMINYRGTDPERHVELLQEVIDEAEKTITDLLARARKREALIDELSEVLTNEGLKTRRQLQAKIERLESRGIQDMQHRIAELESVLTENQMEIEDCRKGYARLDAALVKCHQAALPDPYDERDIDVHWLTRTILKITREARRGK